LLAMADRRGTEDRQVTVPDAVTVGARSDIATVTVTGTDCTGGNRSKFVLREDKQLLSGTESVRLIVRERREFGELCYVQAEIQLGIWTRILHIEEKSVPHL